MTKEARGPGRPAHEPNAETLEIAARVAAAGGSFADVADALGLSEPTVRVHYGEAIEAARPQQNFAFPEPERLPKRVRPAAGGMPPHKPTAATRERVEILTASGMRAWQIAVALGVSEPTLRQHYEAQLQNGRARKTAQVVEALFKAAREGNVSAQKAWLSQYRELEEAPAPAPGPAVLGKKEAAQVAAFNAELGSGWEGLLPN